MSNNKIDLFFYSVNNSNRLSNKYNKKISQCALQTYVNKNSKIKQPTLIKPLKVFIITVIVKKQNLSSKY